MINSIDLVFCMRLSLLAWPHSDHDSDLKRPLRRVAITPWTATGRFVLHVVVSRMHLWCVREIHLVLIKGREAESHAGSWFSGPSVGKPHGRPRRVEDTCGAGVLC